MRTHFLNELLVVAAIATGIGLLVQVVTLLRLVLTAASD